MSRPAPRQREEARGRPEGRLGGEHRNDGTPRRQQLDSD
eukprot:COSAG01_NODE_4957_length_4590_cov_3.176130_4_plen_39_part_00